MLATLASRLLLVLGAARAAAEGCTPFVHLRYDELYHGEARLFLNGLNVGRRRCDPACSVLGSPSVKRAYSCSGAGILHLHDCR